MLLVFLLLAFTTQFPDGDCGVSFVQRPDNPTLVIIGVNSSNVALHWKCNLTEPGASIVLLQIWRKRPGIDEEELGKRIGDNGDNKNNQANFGNMSGTGCEVTFLIFNVTVKDGEYNYRCQVSPTEGTSKSDEIDLVAAARPVINHTSTRFISKTEDSPFTLFCNATGPPAPTIKWKKISGAPLQFPNGETLTVNSATPEHNGTYQCTATNLAGSSLEKPLFDVIIHYKPVNANLALQQGNSKVRWNTEVTLICSLQDSGYPQADKYSLYCDSQSSPVFHLSSNKYTFTVTKNVNCSCEGNNSVGGSGRSNVVSVKVYDPPEVTLSRSTTVIVGHNVILTCKVTGIPQPNVIWSHVLGNSNSRGNISSYVKNPASGERFRVEANLTLVNVTVSMEGNYTCSAHSAEGSDNGTINLIVAENPCKTNSCENSGICEVVSSSTAVSYSCSCKLPWKGKTCSENVCDENNYCKNNGNCDRSDGSCTCDGFWIGPKCEEKTKQFEAEIKLINVKYNEAYEDIKSPESQKLVGDLKPELVKETGVVGAEVISITEGSVIVHFKLYYNKSKFTDKEIEERVKNAVADGKIGSFQVDPKSLKPPGVKTTEATTTTTEPSADSPTTSGPSVETIIIIVVVIIIVLIIIIAVVVWKVKKKRCRKVRKVSNRDEHKLDVRQLSDPSVVPGAVGYNNSALERHYVDKGPTTATPQDDKSKKTEGLYAQVDKSKKSKKKKVF